MPLLEYSDPDSPYISNELPAFFANRVLSVARPNYARYLDWLGVDALNDQDVPFEVLVRTGGGRATDTFHVVDLPISDDDALSSRFFVSGIRYTDRADQALSSLHNGAELRLKLEGENPSNPRAVIVNTGDGQKVGYVPDWLCSDVWELIEQSWNVSVVAERINPGAPAHVRVLCRIDAQRSPK